MKVFIVIEHFECGYDIVYDVYSSLERAKEGDWSNDEDVNIEDVEIIEKEVK